MPTIKSRKQANGITRYTAIVEDPSALTRVQQGAPTLAELIRWYIDTFETISKWQRSKQTHLEFLERHALGKANALTLTSAALIDWQGAQARERLKDASEVALAHRHQVQDACVPHSRLDA